MTGIMVQWTCFVVMVASVRSQDSYGPPTSSAFSPAPSFSQGASSGSNFSPSNNFQPSDFQGIGVSSSFSSSPVFSSPQSQNSFSVGPQSLFGPTSNSFGSKSSGPSGASNNQGSSKETFIVPGGIDFSQGTRTEDGRLCVIKEETVDTLSKDPILECTHKNIEQCHYTYITFFKPTQEQTCEENFEKVCQITFTQKAIRETVRKCYRPVEKVCGGQDQQQYGQAQTQYGRPQEEYGQPGSDEAPEECRTVFESSCTTRYVEKSPGKFVADTKCEKLPIEICGQGCTTQEGPEECHNKDIDTLVDVPEESCDLNPQKTCRMVTKLVPSLKPKQECTTVPKETCNLKFTQPQVIKKPLRTEWCLEEDSPQLEYNSPQPEYDSPQQDYGSSASNNGDFGASQPLYRSNERSGRIFG